MHRTNPPPSDILRAVSPWIGATIALLIAFVILSRFIDTLHESIQRGQDFRAGIQAPAGTDRNTDIQLAVAGARQQPAMR